MTISDPNAPKAQYPIHFSNEVSLWEIFETIRRRWKTVIAYAAGVLAIAMSIGASRPDLYEAAALVQVARVGSLPNAVSGSGEISSYVESNDAVIKRLLSNGFGARLNDGRSALVVSITATDTKTPGLISLAVRSRSKESAEKGAKLAVQFLAEIHSHRANAVRASLDEFIKSVKRDLDETTIMLTDLQARGRLTGVMDPESRMLAAQLVSHRSMLRDRLSRLEYAISPENIGHTQALEAIVGSEVPPTPSLQRILLLGLIGGVFLGGLIVIVQQSLRNRRAQTVNI